MAARRGETKNPRGRPRKALADKETILQAALKTIDEEGASALSTRRVGRELGVSGAAIYGHYKSMDELSRAVIRRVLRNVKPIDPDAVDWKLELVEFALRALQHRLLHPNLVELAVPQGWLKILPGAHELLFKFLRKHNVPSQRAHAFLIAWEAIEHGYHLSHAHSLRDSGKKLSRAAVDHRKRRLMEQFRWAMECLVKPLDE